MVDIVFTLNCWLLCIFQMGIPLKFHGYAGLGHSSSPEEMRDVMAFLVERIQAALSMQPLPSPEDIDGMSIKELKAYLLLKSVDCSTCFEKSDLQSLAKSTL